MDDGGRMISRSRVDLQPLIAEVVCDCTPAAEAKGIGIDNEIIGRYVKAMPICSPQCSTI